MTIFQLCKTLFLGWWWRWEVQTS